MKKIRYRVYKNCLVCGKQFLAKKDCKNRTQLYCSRSCYAQTLIGKKATGVQLQCLALGREKRTSPSPLKGKPRSPEVRLKISQAKTGVKLSANHKQSLSAVKQGKPIAHFDENREEINHKLSVALRGKPQPNLRGDKHWNWQGGKTAVNFQLRNSLAMKEWRRAVFERDDYTCQMCGERGGRLVADHIKPFSLYPELRFDVNNGRTLCKQCDVKYNETYGGRVTKCLR